MPTEEQQKVIDTHTGTTLVRACPGSGKTTTLVNRCKALPVHETKLVLAFNKKAATEFSVKMGTVPGADIRTFHAFCFREVMNNPKAYGFRGKPGLTSAPLFKQLCAANNKDDWYGWDDSDWDEDFIKTAEHSMYTSDLQRIAKHPEMVHDDKIYDECEPDCDQRHHLIIGPEARSAVALLRYRSWLLDSSLVTFDAMVRLVAEAAHELRPAGDHLMVDEFQDVDKFQFDIVCALARLKTTKSFVVVGDPNQRIYEWRGALVAAYEDMQKEFPSGKILPMTKNFRSYEPILELAETVCKVGMSGVRGPGVNVVSYVDPKKVDPLPQLLGGRKGTLGEDLSDTAILCRYNRDCARWQLDLARAGTPVFLIGKGDFWLAKHIRIAKNAWTQKWKLEQLLTDYDWLKMLKAKRFRDDPDKVKEVEEDARWLMSLKPEDMKLLEQTVQREDIGLRIATIHKSKGLEWDNVMVSGVTDKLKQDTYCYYVAVTRAKNRLILA